MASDENAPPIKARAQPSQPPKDEHSAPKALQPGTALGRFMVVSELGKGGMGAVYAAFDPQLNRKVAIKLLHPDLSDKESSHGTARLHREAQALARISHPNVVTVHEVGMIDRGVFIAMEFIEGITLNEWVKKQQSQGELLRAFCEAGKGLSAIHQAGLVHRDFKAHNVVVANNGLVKVLDLGLARFSPGFEPSSGSDLERLSSESDTGPMVEHSSDSSTSLREPLTQVGQITGTRGYVAPEIVAGRIGTALSDQFSFGVALYKALVGKLPFDAHNMWSYSVAVTSGTPLAPPPAAKIPKWLVAVILRALSQRPEDRFPSMAALLDALRNDPTSARRRKVLAGASLALATAAVVAVIRATDPPCQPSDELLNTLWPDGTMRRLEHDFTLQRPGLAPVIRRGLSTLDRRIREWAKMHETTCREVHPRFAPVIPSRRMVCLERHGQEFQVLIDTLSHADDMTIFKSSELISGFIVDPSCLRHIDRRTADDVPPEQVEIARQLRLDWFRAKSLYLAGRYRQGLRVALQVADEARRQGVPGFEAEARYLASEMNRELGEIDTSNRDLRRVLSLAMSAGVDELALRAATTLTQRLSDVKDKGDNLGRAQELWQIAESLFTRLGSPRDLEIEIIYARVDMAYAENRKSDMIPLAQRKVALARSEFGEFSMEHGSALGQYNYALWQNDRPEEAVNVGEETIRVLEGTLGKEDPRLVWHYRSYAEDLHAVGRDDEVRPVSEKALKLASETLEPNSRDALSAMVSFSSHLLEADPGRALGMVNQAIALLERTQLWLLLAKAYRVRSLIFVKLHRGEEALADCALMKNAATAVVGGAVRYDRDELRCRGRALTEMRRFKEALTEFERAKELTREHEFAVSRAALGLEMAVLRHAMKAPPEEVRALCNDALKQIEFFPATSLVKSKLTALLNELPDNPRGTSQVQAPLVDAPARIRPE